MSSVHRRPGGCAIGNSEAEPLRRTLSVMTLEYTKASFAAAWVLAICAIAFIAGVTFASGLTVLAAVAVLPPVVMWQLWTAPRESRSESVREAIR
jgi:hypothetical protein